MLTSIKNTTKCPIEDLLYLINQEDIEELREALLELIDKFQPGGEIYLYEQSYRTYESKQKKFTPKLLAFRPQDSSAIQANKIIHFSESSVSEEFNGFTFAATDDYIQVFAIESEHSSSGLLITKNENIIDEDYIYTLLNFYNQQVYLLRNKNTDSLTGLYNRQSFESTLQKHYDTLQYSNRSDDEKQSDYFAMLDLDFFKDINDDYGHVYGDDVLILFANIMKKTFRDADTLFRYGGEEFALLLRNITEEQAENVLNRFRENVEALHLPLKNKVTVSIGFCAFTNDTHLSDIIERADKALYYSKEHGRNQVSNFEQLLRENKIKLPPVQNSDIELF